MRVGNAKLGGRPATRVVGELLSLGNLERSTVGKRKETGPTLVNPRRDPGVTVVALFTDALNGREFPPI